jgi:hypothetical protein
MSLSGLSVMETKIVCKAGEGKRRMDAGAAQS